MKKETIREIIEIRDMLEKVAYGRPSKEVDLLVYQMFGSLTQSEASGMVMGINFCLGVIK